MLHAERVLSSSVKNKSKLKLQAAMEGTSHPAPPTGGFRKTGNGEQYAFKKVNIEERVIVIYMSNLLPAGGAMSITEH